MQIIPSSNQQLSPLPESGSKAMTAIQQSRQASEVLAAMFSARQFPRNEIRALSAIKRACQRPLLAEMATYSYKRGTEIIEGPSIRLAQACKQAWGNMESGWREVERRHDQRRDIMISVVESYAWDLESNTRESLMFEVPHWRETRNGGYKLQSDRDIYELCANQAARRMRACILSLIPGDIIDEALQECEKTIASKEKGKPLSDRVRDMAIAFESDFGVNQDQIEGHLQHKLQATTEAELRQLRKIYAAIRDGMTTAQEAFPEKTAEQQTGSAETKALEQPRPNFGNTSRRASGTTSSRKHQPAAADDQLDMSPPAASNSEPEYATQKHEQLAIALADCDIKTSDFLAELRTLFPRDPNITSAAISINELSTENVDMVLADFDTIKASIESR